MVEKQLFNYTEALKRLKLAKANEDIILRDFGEPSEGEPSALVAVRKAIAKSTEEASARVLEAYELLTGTEAKLDLSPKESECYKLRYYEGLTYSQISQRLYYSLKSVKRYMTMVKNKLQALEA